MCSNRFRIRARLRIALSPLLCLAAISLMPPARPRAAYAWQGTADFQAGACRIDITPEEPVALEGYLEPENRISQGVHDRLYARAVAFRSGSRRVVLVSCDLGTFMFAGYFQNILQQRFGLRPDELFLCATHTHSGPSLSLNRSYPYPNNFGYTAMVRDRLVAAVDGALRSLGPARLSVGRGRSNVGVNRRKPMPDGQTVMAANPAGPMDPEILALSISKYDGTPLASLFDYACHSRSLLASNRQISGDILGIAEQFVEMTVGKKFISAAFAGASGDIDPISLVPGFGDGAGQGQETVRLGTLLGEETLRALREAQTTTLRGGIRSAGAAVMLPLKSGGERRAINLIAAAVGDVAFLGLDCEALVEIGLAIKAASPFQYTFIITNCNGWKGYLPPGHRYQEGGYEVTRSGFSPAAADILIERATEILRGLK